MILFFKSISLPLVFRLTFVVSGGLVPNQISSPSCISGTACLIICEISLFRRQQTGKPICAQLKRVGVTCSEELEVNQCIALDSPTLSSQSERAKKHYPLF